MTREIEVELRIAGLAILDISNMVIHFIDANKFWLHKSRHIPLITFRADDYRGERLPKKGTKNLLRPGIEAEFLASFPLCGEVWVGTYNEVKDKRVDTPKKGAADRAQRLISLDEIVRCSEIGYSSLSRGRAKIAASIHLVGGSLFADKVITDLEKNELCFETTETGPRRLCENLLWKRRLLDKSLWVKVNKKEYQLGWEGALRLSMTNLPRHSWLGPMEERKIEDRRNYFHHLHLLGKLGVVNGSFCQPVLKGTNKNPKGGCEKLEDIRSGGSESCSPATYP